MRTRTHCGDSSDPLQQWEWNRENEQIENEAKMPAYVRLASCYQIGPTSLLSDIIPC